VRRRLAAAAAVLGAAATIAAAAGGTWAAFSATTSNSSTISSAPDFLGPSVTAAAVAKSNGCSAGYVRQGGTYRVYANVTDSGNPPSGTTSVAANVSQLTTGSTSVALPSGSFSYGGVAFGYRSALVTANAILAAGAKTFSIATQDAAGNTATASGLAVTVDNTAPTVAGADVQTQNTAGGTAGRPETGDTVTVTFPEQMDPCSILANWTSGSATVTVRLLNAGGNDVLQVLDSGGGTGVSLGSVALGRNYVGGAVDFTGSSMVQAGGAVTLTLGTPDVPANVRTTVGDSALVWTPSTLAYDRAGNLFSAAAGATVSETGAGDGEF
jgi:hypothetical protein